MGERINALYAAPDGKIFDAPGIVALGRSGETWRDLTPEDLIPLPEGADLMFLPERRAVGRDRAGAFMSLPGQAVSAILTAGYNRI